MSAHLRQAWATRIEAVNRPDEIPEEPGTVRIPAGTVRGLHYTAATNADSVRREGLLLRHARGHVSQEPDAIWFSGSNTYWDPTDASKVLLEVAVPASAIAIGGPSSNFAVLRDVPPTWIVAVHESWHSAYRYLAQYRSDVLAGEHDSLITDQRYGPAIRRIKSEGHKTAAKFSPSQVATWEDTKPWNASRQDLEWQMVPGFRVGKARGTEDASFEGGFITVKEQWFDRSSETRRATCYHEAGHGLEGEFGGMEAIPAFGLEHLYDVDQWRGAQGLGPSYTEQLAEAYAALWTDPGWFGNQGDVKWRNLITWMAHQKGYPIP